ncbi:MAG: aminotransferase class I/II-fold pyridoxal phosphate-dependent enzyme [Flavobacteriales bacterium]|nr:aminotransferase class I/II-fold pyridoxal phosphate-dependent enzyme [Flavobacteriales bacterium]
MSFTTSPLRLNSKLPRVGTTIFAVMSKLAQECGAINLSQGFPDFPIDEKLSDLVNTAMRAGHNQYAPMPGLPTLREAIASKVERLYRFSYDVDTEVTVTAGGTQAIFTALGAVVHPGDEVIIVDPAYDCYSPTVELFGGKPVHVRLGSDMKFDADAVKAAITPRTRMLMINTPHNPAGTILRDADMKRIADMLRGTDIILLSDEVYEHLVFDGEPHASAINYPELRDRAFVIFSFGKVFHTTGWKMGYALAPKELMTEFRKVHQFNVFSANTPIQHALAEYMKEPMNYENVPRFYEDKRDRFVIGMRTSRFEPLVCEGSYFQLADYSRISDEPDIEFAKRVTREFGVAAIPISPFYKNAPADQRILRFCFAKQDETLDNAIEKLCAI